MRLTCSRSDLAGAVSVVEHAVATREAVPVLSGIHLRAGDGALYLAGTDLELGIACHIGAAVENQGSFVVDARYFSQIVRKLPGDEVALQQLEDGRLQLSAERVQYTVRTMSDDEFPGVPAVRDGVHFHIPEGLLRRMIRQTAFAAATDGARAFLTGVLFETEDRQLRLVATDSNRLAYREATLENPVEGEARAIVPARAMHELVRILQDGDAPVQVVIGSSHASFATGSTRLVTRLIEGKFPNYRHVFPKEEAVVMHIDRMAFIESLERAALVASRGPAVVTLEVGEQVLTLRAREADVGQVEETVSIRHEGEVGRNAYQVRFLLEALKTLDADEVTMGLNEGDRQAAIRIPGDEGFLYIVMPVRLS